MFDPVGDMETGAVLLFEPNDVAREAGVSGSEVRRLANEGKLPVFARTPRGLRLFTGDAVRRLCEEREAKRMARKAAA